MVLSVNAVHLARKVNVVQLVIQDPKVTKVTMVVRELTDLPAHLVIPVDLVHKVFLVPRVPVVQQGQRVCLVHLDPLVHPVQLVIQFQLCQMHKLKHQENDVKLAKWIWNILITMLTSLLITLIWTLLNLIIQMAPNSAKFLLLLNRSSKNYR